MICNEITNLNDRDKLTAYAGVTCPVEEYHRQQTMECPQKSATHERLAFDTSHKAAHDKNNRADT